MLPIRLFDSLSKTNKLFIPNEQNIKWYVCGPTVYDSAHLGHARAYMTFDMIRRVLEDLFQYNVFYLMNITDIDDKIIARTEEHTRKEYTQRFERMFFEDMDALHVRRPTAICRVTESIAEITDYIDKIKANGFAYESNGSVYFDTAKYQESGFQYPKFIESPNDADHTTDHKSDKKHPRDFALWKQTKDGGRPGWHIECSAMASSHFGTTFDIHSGGVDLKFPHHDNEIAQAEAHNCQKGWVNYWLHAGHLQIDGLKMSKSLKNFITIREALQTYTAIELRLWLMQTAWNADLHYNEDSLALAQSDAKRFREFFMTVESIVNRQDSSVNQKWSATDSTFHVKCMESQSSVMHAFCDNMNFPLVRKTLLEMISDTNRYLLEPATKTLLIENVASYIRKILTILGVNDDTTKEDSQSLTQMGNVLGDFRQVVRLIGIRTKSKDLLEACDVVRDKAMECGIKFEDGKQSVMKIIR